MAKRTYDDPLPDAKRVALPRLPVDVWGEISARCDAKTRLALALTCTDFARELRKPCRVEEAKNRIGVLSVMESYTDHVDIRRRWKLLPNGQAHGWYTEYHTPLESPTATFLLTRTHMRDGRRDGVHEKFSEKLNGTLQKQCHYLRGEKHGTETWYSNGFCTYRSTWMNGKRYGVELAWRVGHDRPSYRTEWSDGVRHGFEEGYSIDALHPKWRIHWIDGKKCLGCSVCSDIVDD